MRSSHEDPHLERADPVVLLSLLPMGRRTHHSPPARRGAYLHVVSEIPMITFCLMLCMFGLVANSLGRQFP